MLMNDELVTQTGITQAAAAPLQCSHLFTRLI